MPATPVAASALRLRRPILPNESGAPRAVVRPNERRDVMIFSVTCPACGSTSVRLVAPTQESMYRFRCNECDRTWNAVAGVEDPATSPLANPPDPARAPHILIVDDEQEITTLLASWLAGMGVIHTATTSGQALALAKVINPDLAIVDIVLPRMDGFQLVHELRADRRLTGLPVIFITGFDRVDVAVRAVDVGAEAVLYKPLDEEILRETVLTLLQRSAARRP
jgi:CheY-like chemotaxis protein